MAKTRQYEYGRSIGRVSRGRFRTFGFFLAIVEDNAVIGLHNEIGYSMATGILRLPAFYKANAVPKARYGATRSIRYDAPRLTAPVRYRTGHNVVSNSFAHWLTNPKPLLWMSLPPADPSETEELRAILRRFVTTQIAIMLIEHDMRLVMGICEGIAV